MTKTKKLIREKRRKERDRLAEVLKEYTAVKEEQRNDHRTFISPPLTSIRTDNLTNRCEISRAQRQLEEMEEWFHSAGSQVSRKLHLERLILEMYKLGGRLLISLAGVGQDEFPNPFEQPNNYKGLAEEIRRLHKSMEDVKVWLVNVRADVRHATAMEESKNGAEWDDFTSDDSDYFPSISGFIARRRRFQSRKDTDKNTSQKAPTRGRPLVEGNSGQAQKAIKPITDVAKEGQTKKEGIARSPGDVSLAQSNSPRTGVISKKTMVAAEGERAKRKEGKRKAEEDTELDKKSHLSQSKGHEAATNIAESIHLETTKAVEDKLNEKRQVVPLEPEKAGKRAAKSEAATAGLRRSKRLRTSLTR